MGAEPMRRLTAQLSRFGLVGAFNTFLDFAVTNLLYLLFRPQGTAGLLLISVVAVLIAATNSYFMNARWTFRERVDERFVPARFALVALVGMVINTAVFLFLAKYLPLFVDLGDVLAINAAKLGGVAAAMVVTFLGYRLGVFRSAGIVAFRRETALAPAQGAPRWGALAGLLLLALLARLGFWAMAPVVYGDAVTYSWVAWLTAQGELARVDTFWHSLFDFWQVPLAWAGLDQYRMLVVSTLIPGTLLLLPVYLIARRLYGEQAALLAALLVALHPRLVEYSVNGYAEMFYLFWACWAVWALTALFQLHGEDTGWRWAGVVLGLGLAGYLLVRNEVVVLIALFAALGLLAAWWRGAVVLRGMATGGLVLALAVGLYAGANSLLWGGHGLFTKSSNVAKEHVETLDMAAAARETYGASPAGELGPGELATGAKPGLVQKIEILMARWPRNLLYAAERLPGVLLSPIVLFALALPFLAGRRGTGSAVDELPLLLFTLWPLLFYPLLQLEPRLLFPTLIGVCIFGAAGLLVFGRFIAAQLTDHPRWAARATPVLALGVVLLLLPLTAALAWQSEAKRGYHREVGAWISEHLPADAAIAGDGYGYVSASTFWAGIKGEPRRWVADAAELAPWMQASGFSVLLLYETFLRDANPQLLEALETGVPGLRRLQGFAFPRAGRVQVLALDPGG